MNLRAPGTLLAMMLLSTMAVAKDSTPKPPKWRTLADNYHNTVPTEYRTLALDSINVDVGVHLERLHTAVW